jgi:hypothetical protein
VPETHDIGRFYWYPQRYPDLRGWTGLHPTPKFTESAMTYEIEEPFRTGQGRAFRLWPTRWAVVFGRWSQEGTHETQALLHAMTGRNLDTAIAEIKLWNGAPADEIPEELADTEGVIAWVEPEGGLPEAASQ